MEGHIDGMIDEGKTCLRDCLKLKRLNWFDLPDESEYSDKSENCENCKFLSHITLRISN
jgi:hypothetical protein